MSPPHDPLPVALACSSSSSPAWGITSTSTPGPGPSANANAATCKSQQSSSVLSQKFTHPPVLRLGKNYHTDNSKTQKEQNALTIAISGSSGSGKTTLALLLERIFKGVEPCELEAGKEELDRQPQRQVLVLHQDAYFLSKEKCPVVTFETDEKDAAFIEMGNAGNGYGYYVSELVGNEDSETCTPVYRVTGPDTDCVAAIDYPRLLRDVVCAKRAGVLPRSRFCVQTAHDGDGNRDGDGGVGSENRDVCFSVKDTQSDVLVKLYGGLVEEMQGVIKNWLQEQADARFGGLNVRGAGEGGGREGFTQNFVFVEGFLLFSAPEERKDLTQAQDEARKILMDVFDIKLFLPTTKAVAKTRRFQRVVYIDPPEGTRIPGQMWKTQGYFERVGWENYLREHV